MDRRRRRLLLRRHRLRRLPPGVGRRRAAQADAPLAPRGAWARRGRAPFAAARRRWTRGAGGGRGVRADQAEGEVGEGAEGGGPELGGARDARQEARGTEAAPCHGEYR